MELFSEIHAEEGLSLFDSTITLTMKELYELEPEHLFSEAETLARPGSHDAVVVGFTEWSVDHARRISFGWDWRYEAQRGLMIGRWKSLRTNTRITDEDGNPVCDRLTWLSVASVMGKVHWSAIVAHTLGLRGLRH
ncbi:DUF4902 domain-containing protein [Niveibacterium sp. SC-1]|uniref:DUF4902 domain-containing protein n=1 Tax=Niveibacterium sp. SC-1 TaxID=3135646 RepID=UPI00311E60CA